MTSWTILLKIITWYGYTMSAITVQRPERIGPQSPALTDNLKCFFFLFFRRSIQELKEFCIVVSKHGNFR